MMKYFAVLLMLKDEEKNKQVRPAHLAFLAEMRAQKKVFMQGRFADGSGGMVIYAGESLEQVEEWAKQDPYITEGARDLEIHEWEMMTDAQIEW